MKKINVAVIGATGAVGREVLATLAQREFPVGDVVALASERSVGREVSFGEDDILQVKDLESFEFSNTDIAFFAAGGTCSKKMVPLALEKGVYVIDKSSVFRMQKDVPLIVPEVNGDLLTPQTRLIANPNCVATPLSLALKTLNALSPLRRVVLSTYQAVSGKGRKAMDELYNQTKAILVGTPLKKEEFPKQIAFNLIPHIDTFDADGHTGEETKVIQETRKILELPDLSMAITCVRVPVFIGHSMAVNVTFETPFSPQEARAALKSTPGLLLMDRPQEEGYATPLDCLGEDVVFVSRVRKDFSDPYGLSFWLVSDNLRKGAALNAVQIAEKLLSFL